MVAPTMLAASALAMVGYPPVPTISIWVVVEVLVAVRVAVGLAPATVDVGDAVGVQVGVGESVGVDAGGGPFVAVGFGVLLADPTGITRKLSRSTTAYPKLV